MERKLMKCGFIQLGDARYNTYFFQIMKPSGQVLSYSFEVVFDNYDKIILDDNDLSGLEKQIRYVLPVAYYSRIVAKMSMDMNVKPGMLMDTIMDTGLDMSMVMSIGTNTNMINDKNARINR